MPLVQKEKQYFSSRFGEFIAIAVTRLYIALRKVFRVPLIISIPAAWGNDFDLINDSYEHHHSEIIKALAT